MRCGGFLLTELLSLLAFTLFACPILTEEASPASDACIGYWNAIVMLTDGELTPLTVIPSLTIDIAIQYQDDFCTASFTVVQDGGEAWFGSPCCIQATAFSPCIDKLAVYQCFEICPHIGQISFFYFRASLKNSSSCA